MNVRFEELRSKIERNMNKESEDLYFEVVDAYEKGEIDCNEYLMLYDAFKLSTKNYAS